MNARTDAPRARRPEGGDTRILNPEAEAEVSELRVRPRAMEDHGAVKELLRRAYPPSAQGTPALWTDALLAAQVRRFPEGQWVATRRDGRLLGMLSTLRLDLARPMSPHTWEGITAQGSLLTHEPDGNALYGVGWAVDPIFQGAGIGRLLVETCLEVAARLGCYAALGGVRIPGYRHHAHHLSPQGYLAEVRSGLFWDAALSPILAMGFDVLGVLSGYAQDPESGDFAALVHRPL
jgi:ribosomal protein S18 acetylase RimI-like enzyme